MGRFEVYSGPTIIGYSELEAGDPPMGCASGLFLPLPSYSSVKSSCLTDFRSGNAPSQEHLTLSVRLVGGDVIPAEGVAVFDYSDDPDYGAIEVHVLGIPYPKYEELFPEHVAAYKQRFS